jgi:alpha-tubulin suppressor-like RCC1 family protein
MSIIVVRCGLGHMLALGLNNMVWGMGSNECGQLGLENDCNHIKRVTELVELEVTEHVVDIVAGEYCSLLLNYKG